MAQLWTAAVVWAVACSAPVLVLGAADNAKVYSITPDSGSLRGGMELTIIGSGFAESQFNFGAGNEHLGNLVILKSSTRSYPCEVKKADSHKHQIVCITQPMVTGSYYPEISVDGVKLPDAAYDCHQLKNIYCKYRPLESRTPIVRDIVPYSSPVNSWVNIYGRIFTRFFSGADLIDRNATNGVTSQILRTFMGSQPCELVDERGNVKYLELNDPKSYEGRMTCRVVSSYVSCMNMTFLVGSYGRSMAAPHLLKVFQNDRLCMYEQYPEISVSPQIGSTQGGTYLTVTGQSLTDATDSQPSVTVGGAECVIVEEETTDSQLVCLTPAQDTLNTYQEGNRGMLLETWTNQPLASHQADPATVDSLTPSTAGYSATLLTDYNLTVTGVVGRVSGILVPPHTGNYRIQLVCGATHVRSYISETDPSGYTLLHDSCMSNATMTLTKDHRYYLKLLYAVSQASLPENVQMGLLRDDSPYGNKQTLNAINERQEITTHSQSLDEIQTLGIPAWSSKAKVKEVQEVTVTFSNAESTYRLSLQGCKTAKLVARGDALSLQSALNALSCVPEGAVTVTGRLTTTSSTYTVTFKQGLGDWSELSVVSAQSGTQVTVTEVTKGAPDQNNLVLTYRNAVSEPLPSNGVTAAKLEQALGTLFRVQCPRTMSRPGGQDLVETYEDVSPSWKAREGGHRVVIADPFCGRYVLKNPWYLWGSVSERKGGPLPLSDYKFACFAYKGPMEQSVTIYFDYVNEKRQRRRSSLEVDHPFISDDNWHYECIDIQALALRRQPNGTRHELTKLQVANNKLSSRDAYVDDLSFRKAVPAEAADYLIQRSPAPVMMLDISVTAMGSDQYDVTMDPARCEQMGLLGARQPPTGGFTASRKQAGSPALSGVVKVGYNNNFVEFPAQAQASEVRTQLESLSGVGVVTVRTTHDTCHGPNWEVEFISQHGRREHNFTVDMSGAQGTNVKGEVELVEAGGLVYKPIPGYMLREHGDKAQVVVTINNSTAGCSGHGQCSFEWSAAYTPSVSNISPTTGTVGTAVTVTGSGFDATTMSNNVLRISGTKCAVTAATSTSFTCTLGTGEAGTYPVFVSIKGKGAADTAGKTFTYVTGISAVQPTSSGLGGGVNLTVTGTGLDDPDFSVKLGDNVCTTRTKNCTHIVCTVPANVSTGLRQQARWLVTLHSSQGLQATAGDTFEYVTAKTPYIDAINATNVSPAGGDVVLITGEGFGDAPPKRHNLFVGTVQSKLAVRFWSATEIIIQTPPLSNGVHTLNMIINGATVGNPVMRSTAAVPTLSTDFTVTALGPRVISVHGGGSLTVTGSGFGDDVTKIAVTVGDTMCDVTEVASTTLKCDLGYIYDKHLVTNDGEHPEWGSGYAWSTPTLSVSRGDLVVWRWASPGGGAVFAVRQTDNATTNVFSGENGFTSGESVADGEFVHTFASVGTFYYTSGEVSVALPDHQLRATVVVVDRPASTAPVAVMKGASAAEYVGGGAPPAGPSCAPTPTCTAPAAPTGLDIALTPCYHSQVTGITPNEGTVATVVTITGAGFGSDSACVRVRVGDALCTVVTVSDGMITARADPQDPPTPGVPLPVSVEVVGEGYSLMAVPDKSFTLRPSLTAVQPRQGSLGGDTVVTVTGAGFVGQMSVTIDGAPCSVTMSSVTSLECLTAGRGSEIQAPVVVRAGGVLADACADCDFSFTRSGTPEVSSVTPDTVSGATELTITGSNFVADKTKVEIGGETCVVTASSTTSLTCDVDNLPAGDNRITVTAEGVGTNLQTNAVMVTGEALLTTVAPTQGSTEGFTKLTLSGHGFWDGPISVLVGGAPCVVETISLVELTCWTAAHAAGAVNVAVTVSGSTFPTSSYTYSAGSTPSITSITPQQGYPGTTLTVAGSGFSSTPASNSLLIGSSLCQVTAATSTAITCTAGASTAGTHDVSLNVTGSGAASTNNVQFEYQLTVTAITPNKGSLGGGQSVVVSGQGLSDQTIVEICSTVCVLTGTTSTEYTCTTPPNTASVACDVDVNDGTKSATLSSGYTYEDSLTPTVTGISPTRGGTGGGTSLTISGTGFSSGSSVTVSIDGAPCTTTVVTTTQLVCTTGAHRTNTKADVQVTIVGQGQARNQAASQFWYVDVWSSPYTWGGQAPPEAGELVVIPAGQTLLLDTDTPVLKMLLIQGGTFMFDEADVELKAENILVMDGGKFLIGSEDEPFQHKAIITMYGQIRAAELPIYGAKTLAVRNGTLEMHGKPKRSWTLLAETANAGDSSITVQQCENVMVGDELVISTTGNHTSQHETEKRTVQAITAACQITLDQALVYKHHGFTKTFENGVNLDIRAEVGILTRNILFRGSNNVEWNDKIEACPEQDDPEQFATQTCFQGRFGEEAGSDQFGGQIMGHGPEFDSNVVQIHLSYIEVTNAGQAFRLGRYPIHFHLNGKMNGSYVRGCSIHHTFNRAINIHNTHEVVLENNVVYDVMGGAIFLEDSIERGNVIQYNLALFVHASSSLLNDDKLPAAYWITEPNNTFCHNRAAGGTHFGIWYRMHEHPMGPSYDPDICPQKVPLKEFCNNTAHSQGWYGLWVFPEYHPMKGGTCQSRTPEPAVFRGMTAWNCLRGGEFGESGELQFRDSVFANNLMSGVEILFAHDYISKYTKNSIRLDNVTIAAEVTEPASATKHAIVLPFGAGAVVNGTTFIGFDGRQCREQTCSLLSTIKVECVCKKNCSGYRYEFSNIKLLPEGTDPLFNFEWQDQMQILDVDGSLFDKQPGTNVMAKTPIMPPSCVDSALSIGYPAVMCPPEVHFVRFAFNDVDPPEYKFKNAVIQNQYGTYNAPFQIKLDDFPEGYKSSPVSNHTYIYGFEGVEQYRNLSYNGKFYGLGPYDWIVIQHVGMVESDYDVMRTIYPDPPTSPVDHVPVYGRDVNGAYHFDADTDTFSYLVTGSGDPAVPYSETEVKLAVLRCPFAGCGEAGVGADLTVDDRSDTARYWSKPESWDASQYTTRPPPQDSKVTVNADRWIVVDNATLKLEVLRIQGTLEFDHLPNEDGTYKNFRLEVKFLLVEGGRLLAGYSNNVFRGQLEIIVTGWSTDQPLPMAHGQLPPKCIGVYGALELHGEPRDIYWTRLASTAPAGASSLSVVGEVDWRTGESIVIGSTAFSFRETEEFKIKSVSVNNGRSTVDIEGKLVYTHRVHTESFANGRSYSVAAEVALVSRNIAVRGGDSRGDSYGVCVIVGVQNHPEDRTLFWTGYANMSSVAVVHGGQDFPVQARPALLFESLGDVDDAHPSTVNNCSFNGLYAGGIHTVQTNYLNVSNNLFYEAVGQAINDEGKSNRWTSNLIMKTRWPGLYNGRNEKYNYQIPPAAKFNFADRPILQDNVVSGSESAGFRVDGESCGTTPGGADVWRNNVAHSVLTGVYMNYDQDDCLIAEGCSKLQGFTVWKAYYVGVFAQSVCDMRFDDLTLVENVLSAFAIVVGPDSTFHEFRRRYINVTGGLYVGSSAAWECGDTKMHPEDQARLDYSYKGSGFKRMAKHTPYTRYQGIGWFLFVSIANMSPEKPWTKLKKQVSYGGDIYLKDITFAHFNKKCEDKYDRVMTTNPENKDLEPRINMEKMTLYDVDNDAKMFANRPAVPSQDECVDQPCDAKFVAYIRDNDGSFIGQIGAIIPEGSYQYNGDTRYGLGDYRIPKVMAAWPNGTRIPYKDVYNYVGWLSTDSCQWESGWQMLRCARSLVDHRVVVLENMDEDYMIRRLSPVVTRGTNARGERSLMMTAGPKSYGTCHGYACTERTSYFYLIMSANDDYEVFFTSTSPQKIRINWYDAASDQQTMLVCIYTGQQLRYDVYLNRNPANIQHTKQQFIPASNMQTDARGDTIFASPTYKNQYMPNKRTGKAGDNYYDSENKMLCVLLKGDGIYDMRMTPQIILKLGMPTMTADDFFASENVVKNLAAFLGISAENIRVMNVVSETSVGARRRRSVGGITVEFQIGTAPGEHGEGVHEISYESLDGMTSKLQYQAQSGGMSEVVGVQCSGVWIQKSIPPTDSKEWTEHTEDPFGSESSSTEPIYTPHSMLLASTVSVVHEGVPFTSQPALRFIDDQGRTVTTLIASDGTPWRVKATLDKSHDSANDNAALTGEVFADVSRGWANFTNLAVSHFGSGYHLEFRVVSPSGIPYVVRTDALTVPQQYVDSQVTLSKTSLLSGEPFDVSITIIDRATMKIIRDITWKGHRWVGKLYLSELVGAGVLSGDADIDLSSGVGEVHLRGRSVTGPPGLYVLKVKLHTEPAHFVLMKAVVIRVLARGEETIPETAYNQSVEMRYRAKFEDIRGKHPEFLAVVHNRLLAVTDRVAFYNMHAVEGSIMVQFTCHGTQDNVTSAVRALTAEVRGGDPLSYGDRQIPYSAWLTVNGQTVDGLDGTADNSVSEDRDQTLIIIIVCSVLGVLVLAAIITVTVVLVKKNSAHKKLQTSGGPVKSSLEGPSVSTLDPPPAYDEKVGDYINGRDSALPGHNTSTASVRATAGLHDTRSVRNRRNSLQKGRLYEEPASPTRPLSAVTQSRPGTAVSQGRPGTAASQGRPESRSSVVSKQGVVTSFAPRYSVDEGVGQNKIPSIQD